MGLVWLPSDVHSGEKGETRSQSVRAEDDTGKRLNRWAGSALSLTNTVSTLSFDRSAEPFYNPTNTVSLNSRLQWSWTRNICTSVALGMSREVTQPDARTHVDDIWLTDLTIGLCLLRWRIPAVDTTLSVDFISFLPTSPLSQGASLYYGGQAQFGLSHTFRVSGQPTINYGVGLRVNAHEFTTRQRESPSIAACNGSECAELSHTGSRNAQYQQTHSVSVRLQPLRWWSIGASVSVFLSHLYDLTDVDRPLTDGRADVSTRYAMNYGLSTTFILSRAVAASLGVSTFNPQLAPDSHHYAPFFNRFTQVSIGLRLTPHAWFQ